MLEPSAFEFEMVIEKLKSHKSSGTGQITAEMIKAGGRTICCENHKLINSIWNKRNCLRRERSRSFVPTCKKGDKTGRSN